MTLLTVDKPLLRRVAMLWSVLHKNSDDIAKALNVKEPVALRLIQLAKEKGMMEEVA